MRKVLLVFTLLLSLASISQPVLVQKTNGFAINLDTIFNRSKSYYALLQAGVNTQGTFPSGIDLTNATPYQVMAFTSWPGSVGLKLKPGLDFTIVGNSIRLADSSGIEIGDFIEVYYNTQPVISQALNLVLNDVTDELSVVGAAPAALEVSINNGSYTPMVSTPGYNYVTQKIDVGDYNRSTGYYRIRKSASNGIAAGTLVNSPPATVNSGLANLWSGKRWTALGTSITNYSNSYAPVLASIMGATLTNLGVASASLSSSATAGVPAGIYNQIVNIPSNAELITLEAGINDFRTDVVLGNISDNTIATFYGALNKSVTDIRAANPNATLVFFTAYGNTDTYFTGTWNHANNNGNTLAQFQNATRQVAAANNIRVIDIASGSGIGNAQGEFYLVDQIHLNTAGAVKYANFIYKNIRGYQEAPVGTIVATPSFSPPTGYYTGSQNVTISTATSGATIYYTVDNTNPTTSSTVYSSPVAVTSSRTLKAFGVKAGLTNSTVASSDYNLDGIITDEGTWTMLRPLTDSDITLINTTYQRTGDEFQQTSTWGDNSKYGAMFLSGAYNAIEFSLIGNTDNMWVTGGYSGKKFLAVGDFGFDGKKATVAGQFDTTGTPTTTNLTPTAVGIVGPAGGRRWRAARLGNLFVVESLFNGTWITNTKINVTGAPMNLDGAYSTLEKVGILSGNNYSGVKDVQVGTYVINSTGGLALSSQSGITVSNGVITAATTGPGTYQGLGLFNKKIPASGDGYVQNRHIGSNTTSSILGLKVNNTLEGFGQFKFGYLVYNGEIFAVNNGSLTNLTSTIGVTPIAGNYYRIAIVGSAAKLLTSTDGTTFTDLSTPYTFTSTRTSDLFIGINLDSGQQMQNISGNGLQ